MTKKEIEKGAGLLLAAVSGCEQMVELLRAAVHYCYEQEKTAKSLTPKGYAGFTRIHHIWTEGIPDVPKLFIGSPIQDRDMARGTLMAIFLSTTVFPAETIQIPVYAETCTLQTMNALTRRWKSPSARQTGLPPKQTGRRRKSPKSRCGKKRWTLRPAK